ncbi:MAG: T9SS type A sorting domain-containing protein [Bacteroidia bacterium]
MKTIISLLFTTLLLASTFHITAQTIAGGGQHSLAICSDGTARSWGYNLNGQLGIGITGSTNAPVPVNILTNLITVSAGWEHSLALKNDGTMWAWGYNGFGQLGDGSTADKWNPVQVNILTNVSAISRGHLHTHSLAAKSDGTAWAWGRNLNGQLGDGTNINKSNPVQVHGAGNVGFLTGITAVAGGHDYSLALKNDSTVWSWGANSFGQLGINTTITVDYPFQVHGTGNVGFLADIISIAVGDWSSLALKSDSTLWAWGYNGGGRLGDNTTINRYTPVQVMGPGGAGFLTGITVIAAGESHFIALRYDGSVWAWGRNADAQVGDSTNTDRWTPEQVHGPGNVGFLANIVAISGGARHSVALKNDGTLWAWGDNSNGQLGDGTYIDRWIPVQVTGLCPVPTAMEETNTKRSRVITIFPNPNSGIFKITLAEPIYKGVIELFNLLGKKVFEEPIHNIAAKEIRLNNISAGIYFVKVSDGENHVVKKVVVQ